MDKAFSIGQAIVLAALFLFIAWLFSGGFGLGLLGQGWGAERPAERSLSAALEMLGGPLGLWGGVGLLAVLGLACYGLQEILNYWFGLAILKAMKSRGLAPDAIAARIDAVPISKGLKRRLKRAAEKAHAPSHVLRLPPERESRRL
jgi:hypothetical protein